ncbi:MAG: Wzz/FepE/Etk N-terminal domain-containing protein [Nitrospiria bacterium]
MRKEASFSSRKNLLKQSQEELIPIDSRFEGEEIELIDLLRILWNRRWLILGGAFLSALTALLIGFTLPKVYQGSVVLEIGSLKESEGGNFQLIESLDAIVSVMMSDAQLTHLKNHINYAGPIKNLRNAIDVGKSTPLLIVKVELEKPDAIINGIKFLADKIIDNHKKKYEITTTMFSKELQSIREKIGTFHNKIKENEIKKKQILKKIKSIESQVVITESQIKTDKSYQNTVEGLFKTATIGITELRSDIADLDLKKTSPLELLFLQSTLQNNENRLASFQREINNVRLGMSDRRKEISKKDEKIGDAHIRISDIEVQNSDYESVIEDLKGRESRLESLISLSENTKYRTKPVVLEKAVSPRKGLMAVLGGCVGLMFFLLLAFFLEYLKQIQIRETNEKKLESRGV